MTSVRPERPAVDTDFKTILNRGLAEDRFFLPRRDIEASPLAVSGLEEEQASFYSGSPSDRHIELVPRAVRDRAFRKVVLEAYQERGSLTGLKLINDGGRAEVEAAHIMPVHEGGPDTVRNGIALCGTAHWMFDRGLITLENDLSIVVSRQINDPSCIEALLNRDRIAISPRRESDRPHPAFIAWHREHCFKY